MQSDIDDITGLCAPKSDQMNADDLMGGAQVFTLARLTRGNAEQPLNIYFEGSDRPWRPCKSMMRVLAAAWGSKPSEWPVGARVELYCDPTVRWGGVAVGGIRVSGLHPLFEARKTVMLTLTRGKKSPLTVRRLDTPQPQPQQADPKAAAIAHFQSLGVKQASMESHLNREAAYWTADDLTTLRALAGEIKAGTVDAASVGVSE